MPRINIVRERVCLANLQKPKETYAPVAKAIIESLWYYEPVLDYEGFTYFTYYVIGVPGYEYSLKGPVNEKVQAMGLHSRFVLWLKVITFSVFLNYYVLRKIFNSHMLIDEFFMKFFPFLAFYRFGFKKSYVRI